jgi:3-oxoacyl-[acyl-carrier-protein] synthase-1
MVAEVDGLDDVGLRADLSAYDCRHNRLAQLALEQDGLGDAVRTARERYGADRIGVFVGTSTSGILETEIAYRHRDPVTGALPAALDYRRTHNSGSVADFVRSYFELRGPASAVCTACSSGAKSFSSARRMIEAGIIDAAVVGGVDTLCLTTLYGFHSLEVLSADACRPFDPERSGISIGEGAAFALLARGDAGVALLGVGESSDAHHMSAPHPEGLGPGSRCRRRCTTLELAADAVDYINLHGTATPANDATEALAVAALSADLSPAARPRARPATRLEPPERSRPDCRARTRARSHSRQRWHADGRCGAAPGYRLHPERAPLRHVLSNSFGFGGSNCALVLGSPDERRARLNAWIEGIGVLGQAT